MPDPELLLRIVGIVLPVFAITALGFLYGRWHQPDLAAVNRMNMDVFVPALVFWALASRPFDLPGHLPLALGGVAVVLGSGVLVWPLLRLIGVDGRTFLPPMMFNNSGNMGLPLALFAFGEAAMQAAVVLFMVEMLLHFTVGVRMLDRHAPLLDVLKLPVVLACIAGIAVAGSGLVLFTPLMNAVSMLGQVSIPLLLFSLGVRLCAVDWGDWRAGLWGALLCPLSGVAMVWLVQPWLNLSAQHAALLLLFGALPPAVLNFLMAEKYQQEPGKVASIVMIGNLGSLLVIPAVLATLGPHLLGG